MKPPTGLLLPRLACLVFTLLTVAVTRSAPPDFPDTAHVPNGCYLSSDAFLTKFAVAHPRERTRTMTFNPRGWLGGHTIALVIWQGSWWIRDECFGVFATGLADGSDQATAEFEKTVAAAFDQHTTEYLRYSQLPGVPWDSRRLTATQRARAVATAARFLPFKTERIWVKIGRKELPFLFFRPTGGEIAVYEPGSGTAVAPCGRADPARVVAAVASRLGYKVDSVRPDRPAPAPVIAAN